MRKGKNVIRVALFSSLFSINSCIFLDELISHTPKDNERKMNKIRDSYLKKDSMVFSLFDSYNVCFGVLGINEKSIEYKIFIDKTKLKDFLKINNELKLVNIRMEIDSLTRILNDTALRKRIKYDSNIHRTLLRVNIPNKKELIFDMYDIEGFPNLNKIWDLLLCRLR